MKKVSSIILLLIILCCSCLTACNSAQSQIPCEHNYIEEFAVYAEQKISVILLLAIMFILMESAPFAARMTRHM